jgi:hypothetical protein
MNQQITREILWNVPVAFRIFLYAMLIPLTAAFVYEGMRWYRIVSLGQPVERSDQPQRRLWLLVRDTAGQGNVIRETWGSITPFTSDFSASSSARRSFFSMTRSPRRPDFSVFPVTWWA